MPGPEQKKEPAKEEPPEAPEVAKAESSPKPPPSDPPVSEAERSEKDRQLSKLFWVRVALAVIAGTVATFAFEEIEGEDRRWASIGFMIVVFLGSIVYAKSMRMQLPSSDRKKIVTQGIGSYVFMYLFVWILTYTLVNSGGASGGIPSPI